MRNILVECQPFNAATGQTVTFRLCSASTVAPDTFVDSKFWIPALTGGPTFALSAWASGQPTPLDVTYGNLAIKIGAAFANLDYQGLNFSGAPATVWFGQAGQPFSSYRRIFAGSTGPMVPDTNNINATLPLLGPESDLVKNTLSLTYAGTGDAEGPSTMLGNFKPLAFGACTNIEPKLINSANQVYQYHGYGSCAISQVYEGALSLGAPKADVATYAALYALALDASKGEWASCTALGLFRLAAQPTNKITADIGTTGTVGSVIASLLALAGVPGALIDASVATATRGYSLYLTDQTMILDAIREAATANERYLIADTSRKWHLANALSTAAPGQLRGDRSMAPLPLTDQVKKETASDPCWRLKVGHTRVWSVNSLTDVAGGVAELGQDLTAAKAAADAANTAALSAQADATFAKQRLTNQTADGILDRTEKLDVLHRVQNYTSEKNGLINTANGLGVVTEATVYSNAYTDFINYLNGLLPAYTDVTQDTVIDSTFYSKEAALLDARQALVNANSQRANWQLINGPGKPQDNATVGATAGVNLNDGSGNTLTTYDIKTSVGTSANTNAVAGTPAATVVSTANTALTNSTNALNALTVNQQIVPISSILTTISNIQASDNATAATVTNNSGAITTLQNKTIAYWQVATNAGTGAQAFIAAQATKSDGSSASTVSIGATEFNVYNPANSGYIKAMSIVGGNVVFSGGLQAGAFIRLGSGAGWPVALAQRDFSISDGTIVAFGTDLGNLPQLTFNLNGLAALSSGETYSLYAESLTSTGFTARLKIIVPSAPSNYDLTNSTTPGSGPTYQINKGSNPDASNGTYNLIFSGTVTQGPSAIDSGGFQN